MEAKPGVGDADENWIVTGLQPGGANRDPFEPATRETLLEIAAQLPASGQHHRQRRSFLPAIACRGQLAFGPLQRFEEEIEVLIRRPARWTDHEPDST